MDSSQLASLHSRPGFCSVTDYLKLPRDHDMWVVKPLIPISGKCLMYSQAKVGKSALALQLCHAITSGSSDWMGFPIIKPGKVLFIQIDTPRSTWADRIELLEREGMHFDPAYFFLADEECFDRYPLDILQPRNVEYLQDLIQQHHPVTLVVIDTLRKFHTGDENSSTAMTMVMNHIKKICHPAAILLISHDAKPQPDVERDVISGHRGSTAVVGEMDGVIQLTPSRMKYAGRSVEQGAVKLKKKLLIGDKGSTILWYPDPTEHGKEILVVLASPNHVSLRDHGRALAELTGKHQDQATSAIRRWLAHEGKSLEQAKLGAKIG